MFNKFKLFFLVVCVISAVMITGCVTTTNLIQQREDVRTERTTASYMSEGRGWGKKLLDGNVKPGKLDESLVNTLIGKNLDYFNVHEDLKEAFKKGFRMGYEDRIADLVLGPHITEAAGRIGNRTGQDFVNVIQAFEDGWGKTLDDAV